MKILFLTHRLPYAPDRGDRIRAYHLLRAMSRFARVRLFSLVHDDDEQARIGAVPFAEAVTGVRLPRARNLIRGGLSLAGDRPLTHTLLDAPDARVRLSAVLREFDPDLLVAFCSGMAAFCIDGTTGTRPFVLDMVDVDSAKWRALAESRRGPLRWIHAREAHTLHRFEAVAAERARLTLVVNEREKRTLAGIAPAAKVTVVENGVDLDAFRATGGPSTEPVVIFTGVMAYPPNEEGARWLADTVWPIVRRQYPKARLLLVGSDPGRTLRQLAARDPSITVTGRVEAIQPYLWRSAVAVAPLHTARGLQNKVLEAVAAGLPVVTTPSVWEGLPEEALPACRQATDAAGFAQSICDLLRLAPDERRAVAGAARLASLSWDRRLASLPSLFEHAMNLR